MKLKFGAYYKDAACKKVGPIRSCAHLFDYHGSHGLFTYKGISVEMLDPDLVSEWVDEVEEKRQRLADLHPQEGDVFRSWLGNTYTVEDGMLTNIHVSSLFADEWTLVSRVNTPTEPVLFKDMYDSEQGALLLAHQRGAKIECSLDGDTWSKARPSWDEGLCYRVASTRIKGTVELINGEPDFNTWEKTDD